MSQTCGMSLTAPSAPVWTPTPAGYRRSEVSAVVGHGDDVWLGAISDVMAWRVKTRSGFRVRPDAPATVGARPTITILGVREPVEVVEVVALPDRVGFAYRTLPGHPITGEEAFIVSRNMDAVVLTIRSLSAPAPGLPWRALWPALRVAQAVARRRYLRALRPRSHR
jgi:uncharacterized protein (UPF0548 family)